MVARASRFTVQSQKVEGWAIETLLQNEILRYLTKT
jgi:hypothetical protein